MRSRGATSTSTNTYKIVWNPWRRATDGNKRPIAVGDMAHNKQLFDTIDTALIHSGKEEDGERFMPANQLRGLLCENTVADALKPCKEALGISKEEFERLTSYVCREAQKTFAILVWIGKDVFINQFCAAGFNDTILPVHRKSNTMARTDGCFSSIIDQAFASWNNSDKDFFCTAEWQFLAPVFRKCVLKYDIPRQCPMPILEKVTTSGHSTQFSEVEEWIMHRDHLDTDAVRPSGKVNSSERAG